MTLTWLGVSVTIIDVLLLVFGVYVMGAMDRIETRLDRIEENLKNPQETVHGGE